MKRLAGNSFIKLIFMVHSVSTPSVPNYLYDGQHGQVVHEVEWVWYKYQGVPEE